MKLKYINTPANEGGGAVADAGTIHISEVGPTLDKLTNDLGFKVNLNAYTLGSTGKKEYSGDIDLVIADNMWENDKAAFRVRLEALVGADNVAKNANMLHIKYPIVNYDDSKQERLPRTGFVQVDFNFGDVEWEQFYHFSPGDESGYKGAHRNIAISALCIAGATDKKYNPLFLDVPISQVRWKFGQNGFLRVKRCRSINEKAGVMYKKHEDITLEGPIFDPDKIARLVFRDDRATSKDLESLESIIAATKRFCGMVEQERVFMIIADNCDKWKTGRNFEYPSEIARYLE